MALVIPGRKPRKRSRAKQPPNPLNRIYVDLWGDDWVDIADQLCLSLDLPDLTTRSGLKKIHNDLDSIRNRLIQTFQYAERSSNAKVLGGVISIFTKMCIVDAILQDKLVNAGFLDMLVSVLDLPAARHVALRTLNAVSLHTGKRVTNAISKHTGALIRLLRHHKDDIVVCSLVPAIFAHSVAAPKQGRAKESFDLLAMTTAILDSIRRPTITGFMFSHATSLFSTTVMEMPAQCRELPSLSNFHVALLRSADLRTRVDALRTLLIMYCYPEPHGDYTLAFNFAAPLKTRQPSEKLLKILDSYGREQSEMFATHRCSQHYLALHVQHTISPDLVRLGRGLAIQVLAYQFSLPETLCHCCARPVSNPEPEIDREEIFMQCANALRAQRNPSSEDFDFADVLEYKHHSIRSVKQALELAKEATARNPEFGYFYYAAALESDVLDALPITRKGLKCSGLAPWLEASLRRLAIQSAITIALSERLTRESEIRVAILLGAYEDAKALVKLSPPDAISRQRDLSMYILLSMVIQGDEFELSSPDIQWALTEIEVNEQFMQFLEYPFDFDPFANATREAVIRTMSAAREEWIHVVERADAVDEPPSDRALTLPASARNGDAEGLAQWLNKFEGALDQGAGCHEDEQKTVPSYVKFEIPPGDKLTLLSCAWCYRPSAALKKCASCGVVKYCDIECQKHHWKVHKQACRVDAKDSPEQMPHIV